MYPAAGIPSDIQFQYKYEYSGTFIQYEGVAAPGTGISELGWIVKKYVNDGTNITGVTFADNSIGFNKAWSQRANYTY